jgi:hypothetical protein
MYNNARSIGWQGTIRHLCNGTGVIGYLDRYELAMRNVTVLLGLLVAQEGFALRQHIFMIL